MARIFASIREKSYFYPSKLTVKRSGAFHTFLHVEREKNLSSEGSDQSVGLSGR